MKVNVDALSPSTQTSDSKVDAGVVAQTPNGNLKPKNIRREKRGVQSNMPKNIDDNLKLALKKAVELKEKGISKSKQKEVAHNVVGYCKKIKEDCPDALTNDALQKTVDSVDLSKVTDDTLKDRNLGSKDDYKNDVMNRYDSAVKSYNDSIKKAKEIANQCNGTRSADSELLKQINETLKQAQENHMTINSINIELKELKKDDK